MLNDLILLGMGTKIVVIKIARALILTCFALLTEKLH